MRFVDELDARLDPLPLLAVLRLRVPLPPLLFEPLLPRLLEPVDRDELDFEAAALRLRVRRLTSRAARAPPLLDAALSRPGA